MIQIQQPSTSVRPEGIKALGSWNHVASEAQEAGHPWCSIYRDKYLCVGEQYKEVLRRTPLYDHSFDLNAFPPNSNIYIEGNSWMAQLIYTIVCNTDDVNVWVLQDHPGEDNSLYAKSMQYNVTLLLIDNHWLQTEPATTLKMLKMMHFIPDYIVSGTVNGVSVWYD